MLSSGHSAPTSGPQAHWGCVWMLCQLISQRLIAVIPPVPSHQFGRAGRRWNHGQEHPPTQFIGIGIILRQGSSCHCGVPGQVQPVPGTGSAQPGCSRAQEPPWGRSLQEPSAPQLLCHCQGQGTMPCTPSSPSSPSRASLMSHPPAPSFSVGGAKQGEGINKN